MAPDEAPALKLDPAYLEFAAVSSRNARAMYVLLSALGPARRREYLEELREHTARTWAVCRKLGIEPPEAKR